MKLQNIYEISYILFLKELKGRYKGHALGYLWAFLLPLSQALIYYYVFKIVLKVQMEDFGIYMITGIFPWAMISYAVIAGTSSFNSNANIIKKVNFPKYLLPFSISINEIIFLYLSMLVAIPFLVYSGKFISIEVLIYLPLISLITIVFTTSLGLIFAILNSFFKDISYIITVFFNVMFFMTPIVYPVEAIPENMKPYMVLNPFISFIENWRGVFLYNKIDNTLLFDSTVYAIIAFILAYILYKRNEYKVADYV